jgi:hypothetical protein
MRNSTTLVAACVLLAGCQPPGPAAAPEAAPPSPVASAPAASPAFVHPTTPDELIKTLTDAFNAGDKESLDKLTWWGNANEQQKATTRLWLADQAGANRILEIQVLPATDENAELDSSLTYSLQSPDVLKIRYGDDSGSVTITLPFAERDGKYYISTRH